MKNKNIAKEGLIKYLQDYNFDSKSIDILFAIATRLKIKERSTNEKK